MGRVEANHNAGGNRHLPASLLQLPDLVIRRQNASPRKLTAADLHRPAAEVTFENFGSIGYQFFLPGSPGSSGIYSPNSSCQNSPLPQHDNNGDFGGNGDVSPFIWNREDFVCSSPKQEEDITRRAQQESAVSIKTENNPEENSHTATTFSAYLSFQQQNGERKVMKVMFKEFAQLQRMISNCEQTCSDLNVYIVIQNQNYLSNESFMTNIRKLSQNGNLKLHLIKNPAQMNKNIFSNGQNISKRAPKSLTTPEECAKVNRALKNLQEHTNELKELNLHKRFLLLRNLIKVLRFSLAGLAANGGDKRLAAERRQQLERAERALVKINTRINQQR